MLANKICTPKYRDYMIQMEWMQETENILK